MAIKRYRRIVLVVIAGCVLVGAVAAGWYFIPPHLYMRIRRENGIPVSDRSAEVTARVRPALEKALADKGLTFGAPVFLRIFKEPGGLEVWVRDTSGSSFTLFRTYAIRRCSGRLGPKTKEGDGQAPEGFYRVSADRLNPASKFHLALNVGYPNEYDIARGSTGNAIMIHGGSSSVGCFAMGNDRIEEIYVLAEAALRNGQSAIDVDMFPFRMTDDAMKAHDPSPTSAFWREIKPGYDLFESSHIPPEVSVRDAEYVFGQGR